MVIQPRPVKPAEPHPGAAQRIAQAAIVTQAVAPVIRDPDIKTEDGPSRADILLEAIVITAR